MSQNQVFSDELDQHIYEEAQALEAIANLATASASDKTTIATLVEANASLVKEVTSLHKEIATLRLANHSKGRKGKGTSLMHYCWSCGTNLNHASLDCINPKPNHKNDATAANKKGGETRRFKSFE